MKKGKAAILAIGTELTQGQITNRNAAWISERLTAIGIEVLFHAVVADDRAEIRSALDLCSEKAELLIVTGGLGPTTDDFTREVIADWAGAPLSYEQSAWDKIVRRLTNLGVEVAENNRQQCFFPAGATVLENLEGTADGFRLVHAGSEVLILPGPPREGMYLWDRFVDGFLRERFPHLTSDRLERWKCLGKSEASLGEIVEAAVKGFGVKTGYRASPPYVEVKIWIPPTLPREKQLALLAKMNQELAPYFVARGDEDLGTKLIDTLAAHTGTHALTFLDLGTQGVLTERLLSLFRTPAGREIQARAEIMTRYGESGLAEDLPESANEWLFALFPNGKVAALGPKGLFIRDLPNPYVKATETNGLGDRLRRFRAELAMKIWTEILASTADPKTSG